MGCSAFFLATAGLSCYFYDADKQTEAAEPGH